MSTEVRPAHSPLGASSAERWMNCPGSVALIKHLDLPQSDEPDYRQEGTAAHAALEECMRNDMDAWEVMGQEFNGVKIDADMANAIQVFIDTVREQQTKGTQTFIEFGIDAPDFHPQFYGTLDCGVLDNPNATLYINDYKHGEGIMVDVEENPQIMYYAYGLLRHNPLVERVVLRIIQPRGFHHDGPVRMWETTAHHINEWAETVLRPAMLATELDNDLDAGPWCRFCPAKLVCPLMKGLFGAAMTADPREVVTFSDELLDKSYPYTAAIKHYLRAMEEQAMIRLQGGSTFTNFKLVNKKANRVFKAGAVSLQLGEGEAMREYPGVAEMFAAQFGDKAFAPAELRSPAEMEKISPLAKKLVHEFGYTPQTGLTVALTDDNRVAVKVQTTQDIYSGALDALKEKPNE